MAAFTGLNRSELRGIQWQDYSGGILNAQRKVWKRLVGRTKTEAREASVPVITVLQKILDKYKKLHPAVLEGWIFRGENLLNPLNLGADGLFPDQINGKVLRTKYGIKAWQRRAKVQSIKNKNSVTKFDFVVDTSENRRIFKLPVLFRNPRGGLALRNGVSLAVE